MINVKVNGKTFTAWDSMSIKKSLDKIADTFTLSLIPSSGDSIPVNVFPDDSIKIFLDDLELFSGYIDEISSSFDNGSHSVSVSGSESTNDLVKNSLESPLEWKNKKADAIIKSICSRFGINFSNPAGVSVGAPIPLFSAEPGRSAFDAIQKVCRLKYLIPVSDGLGNITLFNIKDVRHGPELEQGKNLLSGSSKISTSDRHSKYTVLGTGQAKKKIQASVTDDDIQRYTPLVIIDSSAMTLRAVSSRAQWEARVRAAKGISFDCGVSGWRMDDENLWKPGLLCKITAPSLFLSTGKYFLVSEATLKYDGSGTSTDITLCIKDLFSPEPEETRVAKAKKGKIKVDKYAEIRKEIAGSKHGH
jgi:prophage tail gpP-like protein